MLALPLLRAARAVMRRAEWGDDVDDHDHDDEGDVGTCKVPLKQEGGWAPSSRRAVMSHREVERKHSS